MQTFTESAEIERGFSEVFRKRIAPEMDRLEQERVQLLKKARTWTTALGIGGVGAAGGLFYAETEPIFSFISGGGGLLGAGIARSSYAAKWKGSLAEAVMPHVCDFIGDVSYDRAASAAFPADRLRQLGMIGGYNRQNYQDRLDGHYRGVEYTLVEAHLQHKSSRGTGKNRTSSTRTVFKGLLYRIAAPGPAPTPILIAKDHGSFGNKLSSFFSFGKGRGMPRVETGHAPFEAVFVMHAENPQAALGYLPPPFLDTLLNIGDTHGGAKGAAGMRAAFDGSDFYLAIETREPFMELGALSKPVGDIEPQLHDVFGDIANLRGIIDRLIDG